jgi:hypothetical protein
MACHTLFMKDQTEFFTRMKNRDSDMVTKMVKCVLSAHKRKKANITIFDVTFKDMSTFEFGMEKSEYKNFLSNCLEDMIKIEEYEICAEIKKVIDAKTRTRKTKTQQI